MAAEELALHPPVVITIVKPGEEETPVHQIIFIQTSPTEEEKEDGRQG